MSGPVSPSHPEVINPAHLRLLAPTYEVKVTIIAFRVLLFRGDGNFISEYAG
jgi:hypothetical protein